MSGGRIYLSILHSLGTLGLRLSQEKTRPKERSKTPTTAPEPVERQSRLLWKEESAYNGESDKADDDFVFEAIETTPLAKFESIFKEGSKS